MGLAALCPGTFDPVTNGHLDIIRRANGCFDRVVVAVLANPDKAPLFSADERVAMLKEAAADLEHVDVDSFSGLLVDYPAKHGLGIVVKAGVETFFVPTSPQWSYLSSSLIKEIVRFGGDVSGLVPPFVQDRLEEKLGAGRE